MRPGGRWRQRGRGAAVSEGDMGTSWLPSRRTLRAGSLLAASTVDQSSAQPSSPDPLPAWNAGAAKQPIVGFVERVAREGGPGYAPPAERVAVFDNGLGPDR